MIEIKEIEHRAFKKKEIKINFPKILIKKQIHKRFMVVDREVEVKELMETMNAFKIKINRKNLNLKKANKEIKDVDREVEVRELMRTMDPFKIKIKFLKNLMINLNLQKINK